MRSAMLRLLPSLGMLVIVLVFVRVRELSWASDLAVVLPGFGWSSLWLPFWPAWLAISERAARAFGIPEPERWPREDRPTLAVRFAGMVVLAPIAEELLFRGLLYHRIAISPLGLIGAVAIPALFFAVLHVQYGLRECLWILLDGLLFGLARLHSESLLFPVLMHMTANAYAYHQRLPR